MDEEICSNTVVKWIVFFKQQIQTVFKSIQICTDEARHKMLSLSSEIPEQKPPLPQWNSVKRSIILLSTPENHLYDNLIHSSPHRQGSLPVVMTTCCWIHGRLLCNRLNYAINVIYQSGHTVWLPGTPLIFTALYSDLLSTGFFFYKASLLSSHQCFFRTPQHHVSWNPEK